MAKALQCPSCGTKKRLDALTDDASFRCEHCGQILKVPPGLTGRTSTGPATPPTRAPGRTRQAAISTSTGAAPPAPRRRSRPTMTAGGAAAGAGGTAVLSSAPPAAAGAGTAGAPVTPTPVLAPPRGAGAGGPAGRSAAVDEGRGGRQTLPLPLRVLAWIVALPLGLAIVGLPARTAGYLSSQKLLDVIVKSDLSRFVPIVVIILLWALVSALLVTLFVEAGRRLMVRRRRKREMGPGPLRAATG